MKQFTGGVGQLTKGTSSASTARLESTAPVNVKQNPNNVNMGGTIKADNGELNGRNLMHTERVRGNKTDSNDFDANKRNTLAPSPSVPTFKKDENSKRSFTPRNEKEKTLEGSRKERPTTQNNAPDSKQVKSSAHSV